MNNVQSFANIGSAPGNDKYWNKLVQVRKKRDGTLTFTVRDAGG
jgi:hypothetical protein